MKKITKGFTMIELLIVIAVLGILAVAVLAAINPIEQINRGRDTGSRSDAEQLLSAIDRYNAAQGLWPWQNDVDDADNLDWGQVTDSYPIEPDGDTCPMLDNLRYDDTAATCKGTDEVKTTFVNRLIAPNYNALYIAYGGGTGDSVYVCFSPQSNSFSQEASSRCDDESDDLPTEACDGTCATLTGASGDNEECICLP